MTITEGQQSALLWIALGVFAMLFRGKSIISAGRRVLHDEQVAAASEQDSATKRLADTRQELIENQTRLLATAHEEKAGMRDRIVELETWAKSQDQRIERLLLENAQLKQQQPGAHQ